MKRNIPWWLCSCVPIIFFLYATFRMWPHTLDDAYISMQYARQWIAGHGLVFNPGERIEGFSNPLWVMLLALGGKLGISMPIFAKSLGLLCSFVMLFATWRLAGLLVRWRDGETNAPKTDVAATPKRDKKGKKKPTKQGKSAPKLPSPGENSLQDGALQTLTPLLATLLVAMHPGMAYYGVAGLETPLFAMLVTLGVWLHLRSLQSTPSTAQIATEPSESTEKPTTQAQGILQQYKDAWCYVPLALAAITRPEGPMFLGLVFLHRLWWKKELRKESIAFAISCIVPASYLAFRLSYYGAWWPNTYYAKPGTFWQNPAEAFAYVRGFFSSHVQQATSWTGPGLLLAEICAWILGLSLLTLGLVALWKKPVSRPIRFLCGLVLCYIGFIFYAGGDWMERYRLFQPILPLLYVIPAVGLVSISSRATMRWAPILGITLLFYSQQAHRFWIQLEANHLIDHAHRSQQNVQMAKWMQKNLKPKASIITDEIGAVGFFTNLRVLDQWGLIDKQVARLHSKHGFNPYSSRENTPKRRELQAQVAKLLLQRKPEYVLLDYQGSFPRNGHFFPQLINPLTMQQLYRAMGSDYSYIRAFSIMPKPPFKHFLLFQRKANTP